MIYRSIIASIVLSAFFSCQNQVKSGFEVTGKIDNATDKYVYLEETPLASGQKIVLDSSVLGKDGSFHLRGHAGEESLFSLVLKTEPFPVAFVVNDAASIVVNADTKNVSDYEVKGSAASKSLKEFSIAASNKWSNLYVLGHEKDSLVKVGVADSSLADINSRGEAQYNEVKSFVSNFIRDSKDPITSVWALGSYSQVFSTPEYQALLDGVVTKFPGHKGITAFKEMNDRQMEVAKQKSQDDESADWTNKQAPELSLPDVNGHNISLSAFKGKYVLVDFWASWCMPCRYENPNVVKAYENFKGKNFTILGVSLDKEKDDWVDAVKKDGLAWTQVSDLKEWKSDAVTTFNFNSIPFNILIDPNGKIIAQSLRGDALEQKLSSVLQ